MPCPAAPCHALPRRAAPCRYSEKIFLTADSRNPPLRVFVSFVEGPMPNEPISIGTRAEGGLLDLARELRGAEVRHASS